MLRPMTTTELHASLLSLHSALLALARTEYEDEHGAVPHPGAMLALVIGHDTFAWLRPLSRLLVDLDDAKLVPDAAAARAAVERLMSPGNPFSDRYLGVLVDNPDVAATHGEVMRIANRLS